MALGMGRRQRPHKRAQGAPVPEASLRNGCALIPVITVLDKSVHALILGLFFKIIIRVEDTMIFFSN